jgi:hypothetical protein
LGLTGTYEIDAQPFPIGEIEIAPLTNNQMVLVDYLYEEEER